MQKNRFYPLAALVLWLPTAFPSMAAPPAGGEKFRQLILNGTCCVPNLSSGATAARIKTGEGSTDSDRIEIGKIVIGLLDGRQVGLAVMSDQGGGSGIFTSLLLYEMQSGKAITVGSYSIGDRALVKTLSLANGKIHLVSEDTIGEESGKTKTVDLTKKDFDQTECITEVLSPQAKLELEQLTEVYRKVFADGSCSAKDKQTVLDICHSHKNDRAHFAKLFRLTLASHGYGQACQPLVFDSRNCPILQIDDKAKRTRQINLQTDK